MNNPFFKANFVIKYTIQDRKATKWLCHCPAWGVIGAQPFVMSKFSEGCLQLSSPPRQPHAFYAYDWDVLPAGMHGMTMDTDHAIAWEHFNQIKEFKFRILSLPYSSNQIPFWIVHGIIGIAWSKSYPLLTQFSTHQYQKMKVRCRVLHDVNLKKL